MQIKYFLETCRELTQLTTQNGWIDNDSLKFDIISKNKDNLLVAVNFDEIIMEGSGCVAGKVACYGQVKLLLNQDEQVIGVKII